ncbi:MAG: dTDP-4-dehydrorhamnose reductase [Elusimicrobiales bacterium]
MRVFLTGSKGQLGAAFLARLERTGADCAAYDIDTLDIADAAKTAEAVSAFKPSLIINCAAYTVVDKAETAPQDAFRANVLGPQNLAAAAKSCGATIVHFGTDYVFDGAKAAPYIETDPANPLNNYGRGKLLGEEAVRESGARHLILRLSWVFGRGSQNFMFKLRQWAEKQSELKISDDEISVPTYTEDIAEITLKAVDSGIFGLRHLASGGFCSRYEWAEKALAAMNMKRTLIPAKTADFNLPAKRPLFSAMSNAAISRELGIEIQHWSLAVEKFTRTLRQT